MKILSGVRDEAEKTHPGVLSLFLALVFITAVPSADGGIDIPPHVQKIMNKAMSGEELTPQEKKELEKWGQSVSDSAKRSAEGYQDLPGKALEALGFVNCPKKRSVKIPSKPLTREGYISIVKEIAKDYGKRAKKGKSAVDVSLASAEKARDGANLGAALMMMGAGSASVYATAWAAIKDPDGI